LAEQNGRSPSYAAYTETFFQDMGPQSGSSAAVVVPLLCEMLAPGSVVDVGCGTGEWLSEFRRNGVDDLRGCDGAWVDPARLSIDPACFEAVDLSHPPEAGRRFDLVTSLEVGEHLPAASARPFVRYLTELGETVAFSAAIPAQGGTEHVNEQWPDYWSALFAERDYLAFDLVRPKIWLNSKVEFWYRQNLIVYIAAERAATFPFEPTETVLPLVHPELFAHRPASSTRQAVNRLRTRLRLRSRLKLRPRSSARPDRP
jgi:SAM-dependent methyltransferase